MFGACVASSTKYFIFYIYILLCDFKKMSVVKPKCDITRLLLIQLLQKGFIQAAADIWYDNWPFAEALLQTVIVQSQLGNRNSSLQAQARAPAPTMLKGPRGSEEKINE